MRLTGLVLAALGLSGLTSVGCSSGHGTTTDGGLDGRLGGTGGSGAGGSGAHGGGSGGGGMGGNGAGGAHAGGSTGTGGAGAGGKGAGGTVGVGGARVDAGAVDLGDGGVVGKCDITASALGGITKTLPLISVGKRVTASAGVTNAAMAVDGLYHNGSATFPTTVSSASPAWLAIEVVPGTAGGTRPTRLVLVWTDAAGMIYNTPAAGAPGAYRVETSGDSTDGSGGTWATVATVTANSVGARAHTFDFTGKTWVRFSITATATASAGVVTPQIDEIELHDASSSGTARPADTWFFLGDSITQYSFQRSLSQRFDTLVTAAHPGYFPAMLNAGIGGEFAHDGLRHINDGYLTDDADFQHVAIGYGTNDSWGNIVAANSDYEASMTAIVTAVLAAGRVPIIARIPFALELNATTYHTTIPDFNAIVDRITTTYGLPCGPDLYSYFQAHSDQLGPDGVHPNDTGIAAINALWAAAVSHLYPTN